MTCVLLTLEKLLRLEVYSDLHLLPKYYLQAVDSMHLKQPGVHDFWPLSMLYKGAEDRTPGTSSALMLLLVDKLFSPVSLR